MLILISCYKSQCHCTAEPNPCGMPVTVTQWSISISNAIKCLRHLLFPEVYGKACECIWIFLRATESAVTVINSEVNSSLQVYAAGGLYKQTNTLHLILMTTSGVQNCQWRDHLFLSACISSGQKQHQLLKWDWEQISLLLQQTAWSGRWIETAVINSNHFNQLHAQWLGWPELSSTANAIW